jgi:protein gp37
MSLARAEWAMALDEQSRKKQMQKTNIEWTDLSWNPGSGCDKVSPGCKICYAEAIATRFKGTRAFPNGFEFTIHRERFRQPLSWQKPARIFVNSMSDLFHQKMPLEIIQELFAVMTDCHWHTFQILTKRHERLAQLAIRRRLKSPYRSCYRRPSRRKIKWRSALHLRRAKFCNWCG